MAFATVWHVLCNKEIKSGQKSFQCLKQKTDSVLQEKTTLKLRYLAKNVRL